MNDELFAFNRIESFSGTYEFLSNFHGGMVTIGGHQFQTAEHAYQAAKASNVEGLNAILRCATPGQAKRMGRKIEMVSDWNDIRLSVMENIVRIKFQNPTLASKLLSTGDAYLVEGNTWGDTFWGVCGGKGENHLGKILMLIREEIKNAIGQNSPIKFT